MNYFIFNFTNHSHLIESFLESATLAHKHLSVKSKKWFNWKFRENPFGETILACAEQDNKIVGCVAYGIQHFRLNGKEIKCALAFENFVHPDYQKKGVFKKLISLSEKETQKKGLNFLFVFPNRNSLPGYERMGWKKLPPPEYWIKGKNFFTITFALKNLRKGFNPGSSNLSSLKAPTSFSQNSDNTLTSIITLDYVKWRFFSYPVSEYVIIENDDLYSVLRMGKRGKISEAQVLFINRKKGENFNITKFIKACKAKTNYDILSFPISKNNSIRKHLKKAFFIKVPNQTNICYKILNQDEIKEKDITEISLSAINYHTY